MAFRFKLTESFPTGCRRIMREQITRTHNRLTANENRETAIHETRKSMKRLRALMRLIRPSVSKQAFQRENIRFRDINRLLSSARDKHVILETIAKLRDTEDLYCQAAFDRLIESIHVSNNESQRELTNKKFKKAISLLSSAKSSVKNLKIQDLGFETVRSGFVKSFEKAKDHLIKVQSQRKVSDEAIHDWRKSVQVHWRQMALLAKCWPDFLDHRITLAKAISQDLGDDHDLSILNTYIDKQEKKSITVRQARALKKLILAQRRQRLKAALAKGALLFADSAEDLGHRLEQYWRIHESNQQVFSAQEQEKKSGPVSQNKQIEKSVLA